MSSALFVKPAFFSNMFYFTCFRDDDAFILNDVFSMHIWGQPSQKLNLQVQPSPPSRALDDTKA